MSRVRFSSQRRTELMRTLGQRKVSLIKECLNIFSGEKVSFDKPFAGERQQRVNCFVDETVVEFLKITRQMIG